MLVLGSWSRSGLTLGLKIQIGYHMTWAITTRKQILEENWNNLIEKKFGTHIWIRILGTGCYRLPVEIWTAVALEEEAHPIRCPNLILFWGNKLWFLFLPFIPLFARAVGYVPSCILDLYVLLSLREDAPHLGDFILHQVFVKWVGDFWTRWLPQQ